MDAIYSPGPQTLTLISSSSCFSPSKVQSFRSHFLGCWGHKLRYPRGRKCKKRSGFQRGIAKVGVVASLDSMPGVVVVTAMSLSAVVVYLNWYSKRKKSFSTEGHGAPAYEYNQQDGTASSQGFNRPIVGIHDLHIENVEEIKDSLQLSRETLASMDPDDESSLLHQEGAKMQQASCIKSTFLCDSSASIHDSYASGISKESKGGVSLEEVSTELDAAQPIMVLPQMSKLQVENVGEEAELDFVPQVEMKAATSPYVNETPVPEHTRENSYHEHDKYKLEPIFSNENTRKSDRGEIFLLYEAQITAKYPKVLHGISGVSSHASSMVNSIFPTSTGSIAIELLPERQITAAGSDGGHKPLPSHRVDSSHERKQMDRGRRNHGGYKKGFSFQCGPFTSLPKRQRMQVNEKHSSSKDFSSYNRLLRCGRLKECIELLEGMDREGSLDMNKVYHAKFFDLCRSQKAVKEAFHFAKLISNPTLSTFNMLMSVCASAQDFEGAFQVMRLVHEAGFKADCKLYTTLISTCGRSGKVDAMFEVFHEMVNFKVEPNVHTYGALVDGCARAGQVAKAFGAYGILRSKNVKPDRVVFNALITACGQSGAVERAFDVLSEMRAETQPIDPDHVTVGALIKACINSGQVDRVREVYQMIDQYKIKGTPELYTIAVNSCSQTGDWDFACRIYDDMKNKAVIPDEMFFSALIDVAGHTGDLNAAFEVLQDAKRQGLNLGIISYSSLMGACCNTKNWQKAVELYEEIKSMKLKPTVITMNALITSLCNADQLQTALDILSEMKELGLCPNNVTYSILLVASEKRDDLEVGLMLFSEAKGDGVPLNLVMSKCLIGMCLQRFEKASALGEPVLSFKSGRPQIDCKWTSLALLIYRETIGAGVLPSIEVFSQLLGCLKLPQDASLKERLTETLGVNSETSRSGNLFPLVDGFGEYDPRAFSLLEEAASLGVVPLVSFKESPIFIDARSLNIHTAQVYILTVLKGLKHRLAAGAKLPSITILLPVDTTQILSPKGERTINLAGRISQAIGAMLRRLGLPYQGSESHGKIRISGLAVKRWFQPKLVRPFSNKQAELSLSQLQLGKGITRQQRNIRTGNLSLY